MNALISFAYYPTQVPCESRGEMQVSIYETVIGPGAKFNRRPRP